MKINLVKKTANSLISFQLKTSGLILVALGLLTITGIWAAAGLKFDSSYEALLPPESFQVKNLDKVRKKTRGTRQLVIAVKSKDMKKSEEFAEKLTDKLKKYEVIRFVTYRYPVEFFKSRGLWLMELNDLSELVSSISEAVRMEKWAANPMALHLDTENEKKELKAAWKKVDNTIQRGQKNFPKSSIFKSRDGKYLFVVLIPKIKFSDMEAGRNLMDKISGEVKSLDPESMGIKVKFAGNLAVINEQHRTMSQDMKSASIIAFLFGIVLIAIYTRRFAAPLLIGVSLGAGVIWTFAVTRVLIGHVNIITGFLVAVLIGLGIDFGVHIFIRFSEEMESTGRDLTRSIKKAVKETFSPALTSALTTAGTFFTFTLADFRGFSEFGLIAGIGVLLTFASSFLILPAMLIKFPALYKAKTHPKINSGKKKVLLKTRFSQKRSKVPAFVVVCLFALLSVTGAVTLKNVKFKNNFKELRGKSEATNFFEYVDNNIGMGFNPAVFITQNNNDAQRIKNIILEEKEKWLAKDAGAGKLGKVISITDFLPARIAEHKKRISKLKQILDDKKLDKAVKNNKDKADKLALAKKMISAKLWTHKDLPKEIKTRFLTPGSSGYLVYVWPEVRNDTDFQAAAWEQTLGKISKKIKSAGISHLMADETLIVAWIYRLILNDGPGLLILASIIVILFLFLDFKNPIRVFIVVLPLAVGLMLVMAAMNFFKLEINMFNMVVLPSIIGIGIDNVVHIYHRYLKEGSGSTGFVIKRTGAAALLASLTTAVGFGSTMISNHLGLYSLGLLAVLGIGITFLSAVIFLPGFLFLLEKNK